ncbi:hypothetical protein PybrP1_004524 [[Pythium] brassicae (nom. inval.)]|nr:hypothetical protein PybrP1_004524 [[Pythium] brassicae (nom. inval.)]
MLPRPTLISALDVLMGWYARVLALHSRKYTAIALLFGGYRYCRIPMGISTAPDEYQDVIDQLLGDLSYVPVYLDDNQVVSATFANHIEHLRTVLQRLEVAGVVIHPTKKRFCVSEVEYLGFKISAQGITPVLAVVTAIQQIEPPKTRKQLRRFISMVNSTARYGKAMRTSWRCSRSCARRNYRTSGQLLRMLRFEL